MKRFGWVIGLRPEKVEEYKRLHAAAWPDVLKMIKACNIRNYSIYFRRLDDGKPYLFSYLEYTGSDFAADMAKMAADPVTQRWWSFCKPCQAPLASRAEGEWWSDMEEVFHAD
ncbi:MAG: L-rhamnose mutarotase [Verrucomicrobia bacterium]|nr:L-rhamnose mutarotase [Verrucomicrobiota bacterium]